MDYENMTRGEVEQYATAAENTMLYNVDATGNAENPNEGAGLVLPGFGCPRCHERRCDELILNDDDTVTCQSCGHVYGLPTGLHPVRFDGSDDENFIDTYDPLPFTDRYALAHPGACM